MCDSPSLFADLPTLAPQPSGRRNDPIELGFRQVAPTEPLRQFRKLVLTIVDQFISHEPPPFFYHSILPPIPLPTGNQSSANISVMAQLFFMAYPHET